LATHKAIFYHIFTGQTKMDILELLVKNLMICYFTQQSRFPIKGSFLCHRITDIKKLLPFQL